MLAGTEIFIFHHALNSETSILHVNFMDNMFLRTLVCAFTNSHICKRTNNLPIDKYFCRFVNFLDLLIAGPRSTIGSAPDSLVRGPLFDTQHTFVSLSAFSRRVVVSYWRKYVPEVLVNHLGGLSLPRKSVVRLTDRPDMTLDVYRGRKTTMQCNVGTYQSDNGSLLYTTNSTNYTPTNF